MCYIYGGNDNVQIVDLRDFLGNTQLELINMNFYDNENNIITEFDNIYSYKDYLIITQPKSILGKNNGFNLYTIDFTNGIFPPHIKYQSSWYGSHVQNLTFKEYEDPTIINGYDINNNPNKLFFIFVINNNLDTSSVNREKYKTLNFNQNDSKNIYIINLTDNNRDRELIKLDTVGINSHTYDNFTGFESITIDNTNIFITNNNSLFLTNIVFKNNIDKNDTDNINGFFSIETLIVVNFID